MKQEVVRMNEYMEMAKNHAKRGMHGHDGGPFGAVIVNKEGEVIASGNNKVFKNNDPTAHAEIVAIRRACKKLGTSDLSGYILYTSCEPCPMCLSAIIWSNIKEVYYGADRKDAASIGFRDDAIYAYLKRSKKSILTMYNIDHDECAKLFEEYQQMDGMIY